MKSKVVTLEGPVRYAKIFEDNRDMEGFEGAYKYCNGAYTIEVAVDDAQLQALHDAGSKIEGKPDEELGLTWCKFKRKHEIRRNDTKEIIEELSGPPRVVDADGELWPHTEEMPSYIGNDSVCKVAVSVTPSKNRKAIVFTRLEGVQVLEWNKYNPEEGGGIKLPF